MTAATRRDNIQTILTNTDAPVSASALAARFSVSRQIIVGDIALLRAGGMDIAATPRGYIVNTTGQAKYLHQIVCCHTDAEMEQELNLIVDNGCTIVNVIVEHPIYGKLTGELQLASRYDVQLFIKRVQDADARPLSMVTGGVHAHTLACPDEDAYQRVCRLLEERKLLLSTQ